MKQKQRQPNQRLQPRARGTLPTLKVVGTGEPDANVEAATARRRQQIPLYIEGFVAPPSFDFQPFENGEKFIILGQKGTGKTALLRNIEHNLRSNGFSTEYIIFKDSIQYEEGLLNLPFEFQIEKKDLKSTPIYQHCIKRILLTAILKSIHCRGIDVKDSDTGKVREYAVKTAEWLREFLSHVEGSELGQSVSFVADSIAHDMAQARKLLNLEKDPTATQVRDLLKRLNDRLLSHVVFLAKKYSVKSAIFLDEIHFQYSSEDAVRDDAYLVRDVINATSSVNTRFLNEDLSVAVFVGIRSEYMTHPVIAAADIVKTIASFAHTVDWSTISYTKNHPIFQLAIGRASASLKHLGLVEGTDLAAKRIIDQIFANFDRIDFLEFTWGKPRDIVWFLKKVTEIFPELRTLSHTQFNSVIRAFAGEAWSEMKSGLSSYLGEEGIEKLEAFLKKYASISLETGKMGIYLDIEKEISSLFDASNESKKSSLSIAYLMEIFYMIGIFYTQRQKSDGSYVYDRFHRGQAKPNEKGEIVMHRLIAKSFS